MEEWHPDINGLSGMAKIARGELMGRVGGTVCLNILYPWVCLYFANISRVYVLLTELITCVFVSACILVPPVGFPVLIVHF